MSTIVGYRNLHRSQDVQLGDKTVAKTATGVTFVNLDNPRVYRDFGRHSALGNIISVTSPHIGFDDGFIQQGGKVTVRASTLVVDVSALTFVTVAAPATNVQQSAQTATVGAADATNPRIDTIAINTATGAAVVVAGTATAGATLTNRRGFTDLPASRTALAWILVQANATTLSQANVADIRP